MSSSSTSTPTLQACRECGAGAPLDAHFCPQCTKILPPPRHSDSFSFLGLPIKLNVGAAVVDLQHGLQFGPRATLEG